MAEVFFTTGGTVQAQEGGLYLSRPADQQLLALCQDSRFAYVLTPRQLGKSSLMIRTAEQLLAAGFRAVMVDLTQIGTGSNAEQWYGDVLEVVAEQLELSTSARAWWKQEAEAGLTLRLTRFFEEVVLAEVSEAIVIFVDEIDTTLSLAFTDDFFAAIRYFYVARARNPQLRRLSFVLIGVATPADLIRDAKRTPFNIGERVDLRDFSPAEAAPLAAGLPLPLPEAERALSWILGWTGGHPYLSQRLCSVLAKTPPAQWSEAAVDQAVGRTFFGERSEQDNNLQFVRDMLTKRAPQGYGPELLRTYRSIWQGRQPVADEEQNLVHAHLKLAGVVRRDGRQLVVRNRLYQSVFNAAWIEEHNPEDFWKRYGPVLRWAVPVSVSALLVAGVMTALAVEARRQTELAEQAQRRALLQEDLATRQARRAQQAEARAKASATRALTRERDAQRALQQLRQSQQQERLALSSAEQQRLRAEQEAVLARQQRGRAEQQTLLARAQTGLANLRAQVLRSQNLLYTREAATGMVLAMDAWSRSQSTPQVWGLSARSLLDALQISRERLRFKGHDNSVDSVAYSPNGLLIASADSKNVMIWDAQSGASLVKFKKSSHQYPTKLGFSSNGRLLAASDDLNDLIILDPKSGRLVKRLTTGGLVCGINSLAFSPDSLLLAVGCDGSLKLFDVAKGRQVNEIMVGEYSTSVRIESLAWRRDGLRLAGGGNDGVVRLWDVLRGVELAKNRSNGGEKSGWIYSVSFSPDGRTIASGGSDGKIRLWDANTFEQAAALIPAESEPKDSVNAVAYSPDGRTIASGASSGLVRLWNLKNGKEKQEPLRGQPGHLSLSFSPDGRRIVSGSVDVRIWDVEPGLRYGTLLKAGSGFRGGSQSVAYSPDGRIIAASGQGGEWEEGNGWLQLWNANSETSIGSPLTGNNELIKSILFSPGGLVLASAGSHGKIDIWNVKRGILLRSIGADRYDDIYKAAWNPDGQSIATAQSTSIMLYNAKTGLKRELHRGQFDFLSLAFSPDGRHIVAGDIHGSLSLLEAIGAGGGSNFRFKFSRSSTSSINALSYRPSGKQFASGEKSGFIRIWNAKTGKESGSPLNQEEEVTDLAFSPNSRMIASTSRSYLFLWDFMTRELIGTFSGGGNSVAFSPDGKFIATAGSDGKVRRWVASPQEWFRLSCARLAHHPLLRDPASVSTDPELVAAGKRVHQACQAANRRVERAQHQGDSHGLAGLLAWARRLLP